MGENSKAKQRKQLQAKDYKQLAEQKKPKVPVVRNVVVAYIVGGFICIIGQALNMFFMRFGFTEESASNPTVAILILIALGVIF